MPSPMSQLAERLSLDDWERIGFYAVASEDSFLGPPNVLYTLSLVSRDVHNKICIQNNSSLYAKTFLFKFDSAAPKRRLTDRWLTTRCLSSELVKRFAALRRIRRKQYQPDDLWTCYLMFMEGDGKNESQLLDWADLKSYLDALWLHRIPVSPNAWFKDATTDSLMTWLMWMTTTQESIQAEPSEFRHLVLSTLDAFIATGYRFPSSYAPECYFYLPLCSGTKNPPSYTAGSPTVRVVIHYSHKLVIAAPLVTSAAVLSSTVRNELLQDTATLPRHTALLPSNREVANQLGRLGPTLEDVVEFHYHNRIHLLNRSPTIINASYEQPKIDHVLTHTGSERFDEDWSRLIGCHDPSVKNSPLKGLVFKLGSLCGSWAGRLMQPEFEEHITLLLNPQIIPTSVSLRHKPLYWKLQEHHCLSPNKPLDGGMDETDGDDFLNAWFPRGVTIKVLEDAIEVTDPQAQRSVRYETFIPQSTAPYSKSACENLETHWISDESDEEIAENSSELELGATDLDINSQTLSNIDNDDEYADTVCYQSSGVSDILVTGETGERHGDAWGHFTIIGRVRSWDGLVVLLRTPRDPDQSHMGKCVFKGYLHNQNLVGQWRETWTPVDMIGFEGGFVVCNVDAA